MIAAVQEGVKGGPTDAEPTAFRPFCATWARCLDDATQKLTALQGKSLLLCCPFVPMLDVQADNFSSQGRELPHDASLSACYMTWCAVTSCKNDLLGSGASPATRAPFLAHHPHAPVPALS